MAIDNETMQVIERCVARALNGSASLKDAAGEIAKGVTQYVGARYVPLFAEPLEWSSEREYEPLTIVLYQGASYTSRQYVPADTAITNEKFWAVTGNYNAQVEQYRRETKSVSDKYDTVVKNSNDALSLAQGNSEKLDGTTDSALKTLITDEITRAKNEEASIGTKLTDEVERAKGAESSIKQTADANSASIQTLTETVDTLSGTVNEQGPLISKNTEAATKHESQLAGTLDSGLGNQINAINSKFPIASSDIADGTVTAPKMSKSAINSILQGFTVHMFDNKNDKADNTGMVCPDGGTLSGFYIEELTILVITGFAGTDKQGASNVFSLPTYVPSVNGIVQMSLAGLVTYVTGTAFAHWSGMRYGNGRHIFANTNMNQTFASFGTSVAYLKPYLSSGNSASYANAVNDNQIV